MPALMKEQCKKAASVIGNSGIECENLKDETQPMQLKAYPIFFLIIILILVMYYLPGYIIGGIIDKIKRK